MHNINQIVAATLTEDGINAFAFSRTGDRQENIAIRVTNKNKIIVYTAFVDGSILVIGKSDLFVRKKFELADPNCFTFVKQWFLEYTEPENPCELVNQSDNRLYLGDMLENWIMHNNNLFGIRQNDHLAQ